MLHLRASAHVLTGHCPKGDEPAEHLPVSTFQAAVQQNKLAISIVNAAVSLTNSILCALVRKVEGNGMAPAGSKLPLDHWPQH